jgi:hypothetical protein
LKKSKLLIQADHLIEKAHNAQIKLSEIAMGHYSDILIKEAKIEREKEVKEKSESIQKLLPQLDYEEILFIFDILDNLTAYRNFFILLKNLTGKK